MMTRNDFIELLMRRDGITRRDAEETLDECLEALWCCCCGADLTLMDDIVRDYLGLEPDYIVDLLDLFD